MFKKLLRGLDSTPSTPKIGSRPLPELGSGDVIYIAAGETSAIMHDWSSESDSTSSPTSPVTPWRRAIIPQPEGLVPPRRASTPQADTMSPRRVPSTSRHDPHKTSRRPSTSSSRLDAKSTCNSRPSSPQPGSSRGTERCASTPPEKPPLKGILKHVPPPPPVTLHWQLLPYDPRQSKKKIFFDVAYEVHFIRDHTTTPPVSLNRSEMEKPAAAVPLTEMTIRCPQLRHWDVHVTRASGVRCVDVYRAIYETFHHTLSPVEREWYLPKDAAGLARCEENFQKRCRTSPGLSEFERRQGMRRVDLLEGRRVFMGLRRPRDADDKPDSYWVLELGLPNPRVSR
ncbi:hypothetical protein B0H21DRAFT_67595 [Amylocystis lapponica]|nr:hypothetical protein B0H21DRAFT_67595 [Amylocystis lapponica]